MAFSVNDVVVLADLHTDHDDWADSPEDNLTSAVIQLLAATSAGDINTLSDDEFNARQEALSRLGRFDGSDATRKAFVFCGSTEVTRETPAGTATRTCFTFKPIGGDDSSAINLCFAGSTAYIRDARLCSRFVKVGVVGSIDQGLINAHASAVTAPTVGVKLKIGSTAFDAGEHGSLDASGEVVPGDATTPSDFLCLVDMSLAGYNSVFISLRTQGIVAVPTSALPSVSVGTVLFQAASGGLATSGTVGVLEVLETNSDTTYVKVLGTYLAP